MDRSGRPLLEPMDMLINVHSTRLFPKSRGADACNASGIAARCEWVLFSDTLPPYVHLHRNKETDSPRHVFLSLRNPFVAITFFATQVLPMMKAPFVLVSGSEDVTLPRQFDRRWRGFDDVERRHIQDILDHPMLIRWFAENLDDDSDPRLSPLPTGMVFVDGPPQAGVAAPSNLRPLRDRPLQVLCAHRVRPGPQWDLRRSVTELARTDWAPWCTVLDAEIPEHEFLALLESHAFVLCVEGGGIDPSPKAWQSMLHGSIPIIRATGTRKAYAQLPTAFVQEWNSHSLTPALLQAWHQALCPSYDDPAGRGETLTRLGLDYWWQAIGDCANRYSPAGHEA